MSTILGIDLGSYSVKVARIEQGFEPFIWPASRKSAFPSPVKHAAALRKRWIASTSRR